MFVNVTLIENGAEKCFFSDSTLTLGLIFPNRNHYFPMKNTQDQYSVGYAPSPATQTARLTSGEPEKYTGAAGHPSPPCHFLIPSRLSRYSTSSLQPQESSDPFEHSQVRGWGGLFWYLQGSRRELDIFMNGIASYLPVGNGPPFTSAVTPSHFSGMQRFHTSSTFLLIAQQRVGSAGGRYTQLWKGSPHPHLHNEPYHTTPRSALMDS